MEGIFARCWTRGSFKRETADLSTPLRPPEKHFHERSADTADPSTARRDRSSRGADLPAASQEWNERVDIEPLPTHERSCFVSGHDFSRAAHQPSTMGFSPCSYYEHILFIRRSRLDLCQIKGGCSLGTLSLSNGPALSAPLSFLSSRGADLPAASQEWNERVDIEPLPTTSDRALYQGTTLVVPKHSPQRWALAPVPISSTFCSLGAKPRDLQFREPFVEMFFNRENTSSRLDADQLGLYRSRHDGTAGLGQHVYFAAYSKIREVDARFHGEASVGPDQALVVGFEVVQVGPVAVSLGRDAVSRPMSEVLPKASVADHSAGRVVGLPTR